MKHSLKITLLLLTLFILAQIIGLGVVTQYLDLTAEGEVVWDALPLGFERPVVEESYSYWYILIALLIGTGLALLLIRFRAVRTWKVWFFLAILLCLTIVFNTILPQTMGFVLAAILTLWKILRPNVIIHNITEVLMYGGIAAIFVPILSVFSVSMLLILIAIYDAIAVWHSKHMVKLATFQNNANLFAGLSLPYQTIKGKNVQYNINSSIIYKQNHKQSHKENHFASLGQQKGETQIAVLGGGDVAFPLLFSGTVLKWLVPSYSFVVAISLALIISLFAAIALALLLLFAKPKKFYPAMPFISAGCFAGLVVIYLII